MLDFTAEREVLAKYHVPTVIKETGVSEYVIRKFLKGDDRMKICSIQPLLQFLETERLKLSKG